jgi:DNA-binding NtrC family response regulator
MMTTLFSSPSRLLLVEHDPGVRDLLQAFLTREGYEVFLVASPQKALTLLDQHPFHLVLTDLFRTPGTDPFHAIELLRGQAHPIPVGLITGWNVREEEVIQRGFACLVRKPFDLEALLTSIAICLNIPLSSEQGGAWSASSSQEVAGEEAQS